MTTPQVRTKFPQPAPSNKPNTCTQLTACKTVSDFNWSFSFYYKTPQLVTGQKFWYLSLRLKCRAGLPLTVPKTFQILQGMGTCFNPPLHSWYNKYHATTKLVVTWAHAHNKPTATFQYMYHQISPVFRSITIKTIQKLCFCILLSTSALSEVMICSSERILVFNMSSPSSIMV